MAQNPLLHTFNTPFQSTPFASISLSHFEDAFPLLIKAAREEIDAIVADSAEPSFKNTIEALEFAGMNLGRASEIFFNLNSAETSDEMQAFAQKLSPELTAFSNDIVLNDALFAKVKKVYEQKESLHLSKEGQRLLEKTYLRFTRNGSLLPEDKRKRLREIDKELAGLSLTFGENILKETNAYELHLTDEKDLSGIPESIKEAAQAEAKERGKDGWVFTLQYPSYVPFMTYASNRTLRKKLHTAFGSRGFGNNEFNNEKNVQAIVNLRLERAKLLGYQSHAQYILEQRMASSVDKVNAFLGDLLTKALPAAQSDVKEVEALAKEDGITDFQKHDFAYYAEKLKQKRFAIDDEMLKPYFPVDAVVEGVFETAKRLYDLHFVKRTDIDVYHPDVTVFEVKNNTGEHVALFYADFFPRKGKRAGAWMTSYRSQHIKNGEEYRPHVSIVCNFSKPSKDTPGLLTFNEVNTLFHEFGHALHGMLAKGSYPSITGTSVYWDFVELPSQILENWCYEKECLELFAKHYKTGELIPGELIEKIKAAATFMEGNQTVRQISFGLLDMGWHSVTEPVQTDVDSFEKSAMKQAEVMPGIPGTNMSTAFSHIFQGGYSAGYYSYKWAEVLDADAFELFKQNGVFDKATADTFRECILEPGGSEHPLELYKRFRGHELDVTPLLKRAGLIKA
jgi:peptidyl-dipeptidase Dcp